MASLRTTPTDDFAPRPFDDVAQPDYGFEFDQRPFDEQAHALRMGEAQVFGALSEIADIEGVTLPAVLS